MHVTRVNLPHLEVPLAARDTLPAHAAHLSLPHMLSCKDLALPFQVSN